MSRTFKNVQYKFKNIQGYSNEIIEFKNIQDFRAPCINPALGTCTNDIRGHSKLSTFMKAYRGGGGGGGETTIRFYLKSTLDVDNH